MLSLDCIAEILSRTDYAIMEQCYVEQPYLATRLDQRECWSAAAERYKPVIGIPKIWKYLDGDNVPDTVEKIIMMYGSVNVRHPENIRSIVCDIVPNNIQDFINLHNIRIRRSTYYYSALPASLRSLSIDDGAPSDILRTPSGNRIELLELNASVKVSWICGLLIWC